MSLKQCSMHIETDIKKPTVFYKVKFKKKTQCVTVVGSDMYLIYLVWLGYGHRIRLAGHAGMDGSVLRVV